MEKKKRVVKKAVLIPGIIVVALAAVALVAFFIMNATIKEVPQNAIANNVYIGNINVSGMTKKEAKAALKEEVKVHTKENIKLAADDEVLEATLEELGFQIKDVDKLIDQAFLYGKEGAFWKRYKDIKALEEEAHKIDVEYTVDKADVKKAISEKVTSLENQAQNATITRTGGKFVITDGKRGKKVEVDEAVKTIQEYIEKDWEKEKNATVKLPTIVDEPDVTGEDLEKIKDVLGTYTTAFGSTSDNRGRNIVNATRKINGALLMPGDEFSTEKAMAPFSSANGYYSGATFQDGEIIQTIGGGVCQVSTTLYNAVILAELDIVQRAPHSMTVGYVPYSQDAAIASGYKDLKFKNNTKSPIYIEGVIAGGKVTFNVYGEETRPAGRKISFVSETISKAALKKSFTASSAAIGHYEMTYAGYSAVQARLWKVVTENGVQVSKKIFNTSNYRASTAKIEVGIGTDNAEARKIVQDAIATQDEAKIKAAISQAKAIIEAAQKPAEPTTPPTNENQTP